MVQIILGGAPYLMPFLELYIPHGSDNTKLLKIYREALKQLYIPHGSDNTLCACFS